ncbi:MoxR family ATPase [Deinococcus sp. KNUC1210]|uniref:AAA family ATPase n=1 Tax=Deinococcus sp. KNUC1210 TaxID=2917691 RepID=UPI001EF07A88|nr:MoxR family ATPase [Deinococcus sp. KNUC1210]ULH16273.1 MoxR family ATPase [Deinococcus sp. KNUC1210]
MTAAQPPQTAPPALQAQIKQALAQLDSVILGKPVPVRLALTCLLAGGHLLIEDVPGVGKTTLAYALAATLGLEFGRVQFTSDLMPADLLGVSIFEREAGTFRFHPGPIFTQLLLADELNRATPRTQSALLEAMEERQVSVDGATRPLPAPFFVVATQNPATQAMGSAHGTFPLPEAQLDRFLLTVTLGYPDPRAERELLLSGGRREAAQGLAAALSPADLQSARQGVAAVHVSGALIDYVQLLVKATRDSAQFVMGLSPRAALGLIALARAWAWLHGRNSVWPDDVRAVFPALATHRLLGRSTGTPQPDAVRVLLEGVPIP